MPAPPLPSGYRESPRVLKLKKQTLSPGNAGVDEQLAAETEPLAPINENAQAFANAAQRGSWSSVVSSADREGLEPVEFDIPEDTYGVAILAIVKDMHMISDGEDRLMSLTRFLTAAALLCMNLLSQILVLVFISSHVVRPAVRSVQELYHDFHAKVFDAEGQFLEEDWRDWAYKEDLCQIAMTNHVFYYLIVFLWTMSMMHEFRTSERLFRDINSMPACRSPEQMIEEREETGHSIVALMGSTRALLYMLVCGPKFSISLYLWYCGAEVLSATTSFQDLVLNTVAMSFVTLIDELLYHALLPAPYQKQVRKVNFEIWDRPSAEKSKRSERISYIRSCIYLLGGMIMISLYGHFGQDVLPKEAVSEINSYCISYSEGLRTVCTFSQLVTGGYTECFPYGVKI